MRAERRERLLAENERLCELYNETSDPGECARLLKLILATEVALCGDEDHVREVES